VKHLHLHQEQSLLGADDVVSDDRVSRLRHLKLNDVNHKLRAQGRMWIKVVFKGGLRVRKDPADDSVPRGEVIPTVSVCGGKRMCSVNTALDWIALHSWRRAV
jgi:hypothetical protein